MTDKQFGRALRAMYEEEGWTMERMAEAMKCTVQALAYHMDKHGIRRRPRGRPRRDYPVPQRFLMV